jgi:hypothetical protein
LNLNNPKINLSKIPLFCYANKRFSQQQQKQKPPQINKDKIQNSIFLFYLFIQINKNQKLKKKCLKILRKKNNKSQPKPKQQKFVI